MAISRLEHPKPQFKRDTWLNLNGQWDFAFDFSKSGKARKFYETGDFTHKINVPFCPESTLSGINYTDFIPAVWYRRRINLTPQQLEGEVLLHFGAVDYATTVYVNGVEAGTHVGGYASFSFEIRHLLHPGSNVIVVYAEDDTRDIRYPSGKQSNQHHSYGCMYTRTTGIWQTVWLEFVPKVYIKKIRIYPNAEAGSVGLHVWLSKAISHGTIKALASYDAATIGKASVSPAMMRAGKTSVSAMMMGAANVHVCGDFVNFTLSLSQKHLWDIDAPNLYDLSLQLFVGGRTVDAISGASANDPTNSSYVQAAISGVRDAYSHTYTDKITSYFGLRTITLQDNAIHLNGRPVYQKLVLDQGYYPDSIYTAPSDEALIQDIQLSMALGFNGARLHEKVFEERFLYHADRLGYLVWGEHANWGFDHSNAANIVHFLPEWMSIVERDFNHPSIIGWCPFNETWDHNGHRQDNNLIALVYEATKALDPTRPVIDTSGCYHVTTDIYDVHDYEQDVDVFTERYGSLKKGQGYDTMPDRQQYGGQPFFVSEYGGARFSPEDGGQSWGYGNAPATEEAFIARYEGLTSALLNAEGICALCYTQLYDVEQEKNGLYTYERKKKFSDDVYQRIRAVNMSV